MAHSDDPSVPTDSPADPHRPAPRRDALAWIGLGVAVLAVGVVGWACVTGWGGVVHGHPAYAILLVLTLAVALWAVWRTARPRVRRGGWRFALRIVAVVLALGWVALIAWLRPYSAEEPALTAMQSTEQVEVAEAATSITMTPADGAGVGVFFQPGALVDPRAYAAVLRPLAEAGHTVVIAKQPLGIAFLALGAFDDARGAHGEVGGWVVGGHSLGGTVAAMQADDSDADAASPAVGLLFYASYPADDISETLTVPVTSISGTQDGLATPAKIEASRADLPAATDFVVIEGGSHAQFGDYGPQAGDGTPTISHDDARSQISAASLDFVSGLQ